MCLTTPISTRWRVVGPLVAAGAAVLPGSAARAESTTSPRELGPSTTDSLISLLALTPADAVGSTEIDRFATYADIAVQLAAGEIERPASVDDEPAMTHLRHATKPLVNIGYPLATSIMHFQRDVNGFDITDLDQLLQSGRNPELITLLRGRFDQDAVAAAWIADGYDMLDIDGIAVASLFDDVETEGTTLAGRFAVMRMNNAAFLPDGTLVYTATMPLMEAVIATATGEAPSLAEREEIVATVASVDQPLASAILAPGAAFSTFAQSALEGSDLTIHLTEQMPAIAFGLIGTTPGGPLLLDDDDEEPAVTMSPATSIYRLLMAEPGTADESAVIADNRLSTLSAAVEGEPYTDYFGSWDAAAINDGDVLAIDLLPADGQRTVFWPRFFLRRHLHFLAW